MAAARPAVLLRLLVAGAFLGGVSCRELERTKSIDQKGAHVAEADEGGAIRRLFDEAAACGNRYKCPPSDELLARAERPDGTAVAAVAFELMTDPQVRSFDRLGTVAYDVALAWTGARVKAGTFDADAKSRFLGAVRGVLSADSSTFVEPVYTLFAGPIGDAIPESKDLLIREATDPRRELGQMDMATKVLQRFLPDLSQARSWLESDDERRRLAAISLLDYTPHDRFTKDDELRLLTAAARRPGVSALLAQALIRHVRMHDDDAQFQAVIAPLRQHEDPEVREAAAAAAGASGH